MKVKFTPHKLRPLTTGELHALAQAYSSKHPEGTFLTMGEDRDELVKMGLLEPFFKLGTHRITALGKAAYEQISPTQ